MATNDSSSSRIEETKHKLQDGHQRAICHTDAALVLCWMKNRKLAQDRLDREYVSLPKFAVLCTANTTIKAPIRKETNIMPAPTGIALWLHLSEQEFVQSDNYAFAYRALLLRYKFSCAGSDICQPLLLEKSTAARKVFEINRERQLCFELLCRDPDAERKEPNMVNTYSTITVQAPVNMTLSLRSDVFYHVRVRSFRYYGSHHG